MTYQKMKIALSDPFGNRTHIANVLHNLGYQFVGDAAVYNNAKAFFTYDNGIIMKTDDMEYFKSHPNEEYVLVGDELKKASTYFVQPETQCKCFVCEDQQQNVDLYTAHDAVDDEQLITKQQAIADKVLDKLFPIDPFAICAGGAPRDWHFGKPAADLDIFFYTSVDQLTIVAEMLRHVGINLMDEGRAGEDLPEWYKLNPDLNCVFSAVVDGVNVQLMFMKYKTQDTVVPQFPLSICKAWYKHGMISLDKDFKICEKHKVVVQTNKLYSDEHKYVQKIKAKFPDYEFFSTWEDAYKYVFEKGSV
jgi:hypothetical protein